MKGEYDDIINLPHHVSKKHPPMLVMNRAAQFAPFAALTGHDAAIKETARLTNKRVELDEYEKENLIEKLNIIATHIDEHPKISITYFRPDDNKDGGEYLDITDHVMKIDKYERIICMKEGSKIPIDEIIQIEGKIISNTYDEE